MSTFLIIQFVLLFYDTKCSLTTDYYMKLIHQETLKVLTSVLPEQNEEFKGADSETTNAFGTYDFVIVGAGSAGSVLATRLSEIDNFRILLLEAGGEENDFSNIPGLGPLLQIGDLNWGYSTTPQKHSCLGMKNKKCLIPQGKVVGGSSSTNGILYSRGAAKDYDKWAEMGNTGWSYKHVLPYFIKSENSQVDGDVGYHGKGGLWNVEHTEKSPFFSRLVEASLELNLPVVDYNGKDQIGLGLTQFNMKRGKRQSLGTAFLDGARKRRNLVVVTRALVTKLCIDLETKITRGVEFIHRNQTFRALVTNEVILSVGAINSPQLLMLSGIGPKHHLEDLGIKVLADLPVGQNLIDHPMFSGLRIHTQDSIQPPDFATMVEEFTHAFGPLTKSYNMHALMFINTTNISDKLPDVEYIFVPPSGNNEARMVSKIFNSDNKLTQFLEEINPTNDIYVAVVLLHERSRGTVTLKSTNPLDFPNIDTNMLAEPEDVDTFIKGIEFALKLFETRAFREINAEPKLIQFCKEFGQGSRQYWECALRHMTLTTYHPCGTTAMGVDGTMSVVDSKLKVHGIQGLRVVDAGVFPSSVSGHINAPTVMVAEKISDDIKREYGFEENTEGGINHTEL
ncbi:hypothetical protein Zmor_009781 [Zophobas morio]|uniref:Glucose-methanol-choline oxidoreductase N-terminal domain-containing protein n=1 Tax=Zophobas morio TaxID=2755281 RepID=A0AA38MJ48_9CUCU|nr:hypothetical protein Zmor_009781 [Zophobas morio]